MHVNKVVALPGSQAPTRSGPNCRPAAAMAPKAPTLVWSKFLTAHFANQALYLTDYIHTLQMQAKTTMGKVQAKKAKEASHT